MLYNQPMEAIEPTEILASNRESCRKRIGISLDGYSKRGENIVALEWRCGSGFIIICAGDLQCQCQYDLSSER